MTNAAEDFVYTQQFQKLCAMLAATAGLQRQLGLDPEDAGSAEEAAQHVLPPLRDPEDLRHHLPAIVVEVATELSFECDASGARHELTEARGTFRLIIADNAKSDDDLESYLNFLAFAGAVLSGLAEQSAVSDNLAITNLSQSGEPLLSDDVESAGGPWWLTEWMVTWE